MDIFDLQRRGNIALLTLNRPDTLNALGRDGDGEAMQRVCDTINADADLRCVVLTGAGRAFSAGGDVKAMQERSGAFGGGAMHVRAGYRGNIHRLVQAIYRLDLPVIAAVNGPAIGLGCDIACLADIRLASDAAKFGATFLKLGLVPGDGGAWLLPRVIGMSRACELLFTGKLVDAATALEWGLISRVVPHESLLDTALQMAAEIAAQPPHALRLTKALLRQGQVADFATVMETSALTQVICHSTEDHMEGVGAILEKRSPHFEGR